MITKAIDEMKEQLKLCSDAVINNTKIITPEEIGQDYLLHIAIRKIPEFIPYHSRASAYSEDNTIPRVHTSPTLAGCIIGFSMSGYLTSSLIPNNTKKDKNNSLDSSYLGGFYIHKIPFEVALKPNKKLVYDTKESDETWLITYNESTRKFPATVIGRMINSKLEVIPRIGKPPSNINIFLMEITEQEGIYLDKDTLLSKGHWKIAIDVDSKEMVSTKITEKEYGSDHEAKASMLSFKEPPAYHKW
jgi:hypothetical protein